MKTIIVPTDFSSYADKAMDFAVMLAIQAKAKIILLHVCELYDYRFSRNKTIIKEHNSNVINDSNSKLDNLKNEIKNRENIEIVTSLYNGNVVESIIEAASINDADLIIMGSLGETGLRRTILGSKVAETISKSIVPVMAVPFNYNMTRTREILVALNDPNEELSVLQPVFDLAELFHAQVTVAIFTDADNDAPGYIEDARNISTIQKKLIKLFHNENVKSIHLSGDDFQEVLQNFVNTKGIGLLAMMTHKRNVVQSLFNKSMTQMMSYHTNVPLLSIQAQLSTSDKVEKTVTSSVKSFWD